MNIWKFKAVVLNSEINLNIIAAHFGINKKFKWEDALILAENSLNGIIKDSENKSVYIYYFGSLVFINMEYHEIQDIIKYIKTIDDNLKNISLSEYTDDYTLEVAPDLQYSIGNETMTAGSYESYYPDIISMVLAKSISLEKIENEIDKLLDNIDNVINYLELGKFNVSDKELARTSAKIIRFKYNTISNLMIFEKPSAAWVSEDVEQFFLDMMRLFEIEDRYSKINHKTEILKDINEVFGNLTHERRATKLEIMVIILIMMELIVSLLEFIPKHLI